MSSFVADKIVMDGLTYDDVLLIPAYSEVLPKEVELKTKFSRNIELNIPFVTAAMDTVTEASMYIYALGRKSKLVSVCVCVIILFSPGLSRIFLSKCLYMKLLRRFPPCHLFSR